MVVDLQFMMSHYAPLVLQLSQLLEERFVPNAPVNSTPIGQALNLIIVRQNEGDIRGRDVQYMRMQSLVKHLMELRDHSESVLNVYRKKLTDPDMGNFLGARFEIYIAASLVRAGIAFQRRSQGGPDFVLGAPYEGLGIECASLHLMDPTKASYALEKIESVVATKSEKDYANNQTVLAIDVTNIQAASIDHGDGAAIQAGNAVRLQELTRQSGFGSILPFWHQLLYEDQRLTASRWRYARVDHEGTDPRLVEFLESHYSGRGGGGDPPDWRVPYMP